MADNTLPQTSTGPTVNNDVPLYANADYEPVRSNWFTAKPYGFRFTPKNGGSPVVMYLPIGPSNLSISTHFATNLVSTIYGTVEEHSPVRYFDITIQGTTGMVPKYVHPVSANEIPQSTGGRTFFTIQQTLSTDAGGFFAKTLSIADKVAGGARDLVGRSAVTGVQLDQTGYLAFHNLYRFFLKYKKDVSGTDTKNGAPDEPAIFRDDHPLVFFNYKDNNEYNVVVRGFSLQRDKDNPMLYMYSISLRGYELKQIGNSKGINNVAPDQAKMLAALGLNGVKGSVFLAKAKEKASEAREILSSIAIGINQLGR